MALYSGQIKSENIFNYPPNMGPFSQELNLMTTYFKGSLGRLSPSHSRVFKQVESWEIKIEDDITAKMFRVCLGNLGLPKILCCVK